jgi:hypothetical protein
MSTTTQIYNLLRSRLSGVAGVPAAGADGDEVLWAIAAAMNRVGGRCLTEIEQGRILKAQLRGWATGTITITWTAEWVNNIIISVGSRIARAPWGVEYILAELPIGRSSGEPPGSATYAVRARWASLEHNTEANHVNTLIDTDRMSISVGGTAAKAEWAAGIASGAISITASSAMTGGKLGLLEMHARDAGVPVSEGETEAQVRRRLRARPGGITPNNIGEAVIAMLGTDDVQLLEPWTDGEIIGVTPIGTAPIWGGLRWAIIVVPAGTDVDAVQAYVDRMRAFGFRIQVIEGD